MAYNENIDERIKNIVAKWKDTSSKKMFGGVYKDYLILRIGEEESVEALKRPKVKPFDITGRPMKGWIMVEEDGFQSDKELSDWLETAKQFVHKLPPK